MLDDFLIRAALAGIGVALVCGPLGSFVIWRRMAYFGDATAHAAVLGVALSLGFGLSVFVGTLVVAVAMALTVARLSARGATMDSALGVLSHGALALGIVAATVATDGRISLESWLFGDILAVGRGDIAVIWLGSGAVLGVLWWRWNGLLAATLNPELAASAGIDPKREELVLTIALAVVVAVAMKVVGALLIAAMLIIPAAAARPLVRTPEAMAAVAAGIGLLSVGLGLQGSFLYDTPTGPSIVTAAAALYAVAFVLRRGGG